jgi:hypothetical protein
MIPIEFAVNNPGLIIFPVIKLFDPSRIPIPLLVEILFLTIVQFLVLFKNIPPVPFIPLLMIVNP